MTVMDERIELLISGVTSTPKVDDMVETQWKYFQRARPETDWDKLFPHVPTIIEELKNEDPNLRQ